MAEQERPGVSHALTKGLQEGFAGQGIRSQEIRAGVPFEVNTSSDGTYDDRYTGQISAGGQEIVRVGEEAFTRVYAGGTIAPEALAKLGLTKKDVIRYLKQVITENGKDIRLFTPFHRQDGAWAYQYDIIKTDPTISLTMGRESISHEDQLVFVHGFLLSPVK